MYSIRTTEGFIVDSRPYGEAGRVFSVLTRDLGLIQAIAQGIRLEKSKLRYHTKLYSFGTYSFVKGKDIWRMTNANSADFFVFAKNEKGQEFYAQELFARIAFLLKRLVRGEVIHPEIFDHLMEAAKVMDDDAGIGNLDFETLETVLVLRIMHALGYVGKVTDEIALKGNISKELLSVLSKKRSDLNIIINTALKESQL